MRLTELDIIIGALGVGLFLSAMPFGFLGAFTLAIIPTGFYALGRTQCRK